MIAATNKDLEQEIERGTFREDLYFRLSVSRSPCRRCAIGARTFRRWSGISPTCSAATITAGRSGLRRRRSSSCRSARWKGNVRELKNTVERLIIMTPGETIDVDDLRDVVRLEPKPQASDNDKNPDTLREFKESAERAFLVGKLRENNWNISKTAEVIGTPRSNLYKKLEQYGITAGGETDKHRRSGPDDRPLDSPLRGSLRTGPHNG